MSYQKIPTESPPQSQSSNTKRNMLLSLIAFGGIIVAFFVLLPTFQGTTATSTSTISPDYSTKAINTVSQMHFALDTADWDTFKSTFDEDGVSMEYMGNISTMTPEELVEMVKPDIQASVHSQHQLGNFVVDIMNEDDNNDGNNKYYYPKHVRVQSYLTATFQFENEIKIFYATYDMVLTYKEQYDRYVMSSEIFHPKFQTNNDNVNITSF